MHHVSARLCFLIFCSALSINCGSGTGTAGTSSETGALERLRVQFGWAFDAHHLGFLAARDLGLYRAAGLDVTLTPGGFDSSPIRTLVSGGAEVAQISGVEQLLGARQEGLPVVAIAAFHRTSPHALISLSRRPLRAPADLKGSRIAVAFGDSAEYLLRDLMVTAKLTDKDVTLVPFRFDLTPLIDGQVDGITGFATDQPHTLASRGLAPTILSYSRSEAAGYGYMFVARKESAAKLKEFVEASRKGWSSVFADPEKALDLLMKGIPGLDRSIERAKLTSVRTLMFASGELATWCMTEDVIKGVEDRLIRYGQLRAPLPIGESFSNEYCQ